MNVETWKVQFLFGETQRRKGKDCGLSWVAVSWDIGYKNLRQRRELLLKRY